MPRRCEVRWLLSLTALLLCLSDLDCLPAEQAPGWRSSCPSGFTPCGGRCYARLDKAVVYGQAKKDCNKIDAHLAVPHSQDQNLCVAGLAAYENVWLGITDIHEEGVFLGHDCRPILPNEGQVWAKGHPNADNADYDCLAIGKEGENSEWEFAEWSGRNCFDKNYPMCQLSADTVDVPMCQKNADTALTQTQEVSPARGR